MYYLCAAALKTAATDEKSGRKDSLSLNVDCVKMHLARSRKTQEVSSAAGRKGERFCNNVRISCEFPLISYLLICTQELHQ